MKATLWIRIPLKVALVLALTGFAGAAPCQADRMSADLRARVNADPHSNQQLQVVAQFTQTVNASEVARGHKGSLDRNLSGIRGASMRVPIKHLDRLARHPLLVRLSPDRALGAQWDNDVQAIGADLVWAGAGGWQGSGTGVAVLDTGVYKQSSDWSATGGGDRIRAWRDLVNGQPQPYDDNGHGTHVAGIVLGNGTHSNISGLGGLFTGVGKNADLIAVKVLDQNGMGLASTVIAGIDWCVENRVAYNIRAINLSLGHEPLESNTTDPLCSAVRSAVEKGIVVVCSAGNYGKDALGDTKYGGITNPGIEPAAITVGATNTQETTIRTDDTVTSFSSRGPTRFDNRTKPDLVAPGNRIVSVRAKNSLLDFQYPENRVDPTSYGGSGDSEYFILSGTSMAAPQVAGTVALMLQANPSLKPNSVKALLMYTAEKLIVRDAAGLPLSAGLSTLTQGAGSLNAAGAVEAATKVDQNAAVGSPWLTSSLSGQTTIAGSAFAWASSALYRVNTSPGGNVVSGAGLMANRQALFGDQVTWGEQVTWGDQVTWGSDGVPEDQVIWGNNLVDWVATASAQAFLLMLRALRILGD